MPKPDGALELVWRPFSAIKSTSHGAATGVANMRRRDYNLALPQVG
jgi:hypothetical protein